MVSTFLMNGATGVKVLTCYFMQPNDDLTLTPNIKNCQN